MSDIASKLAKPVAEFLAHMGQHIPRALGKAHHRVSEHVHTAANHFDDVENRLKTKAGGLPHEHGQHRAPHTPGADGAAARTPHKPEPETPKSPGQENLANDGDVPPEIPDNPELNNLMKDRRPSYRKKTRFAVYRDAQRAQNGEDFVCPNSKKKIPCERDSEGNALKYNERGQPVGPDDPNGFTVPKPNPHSKSGIPPNYHFGHIPGSEYRRLVALVRDHPGRFSWRQILNEYNKPEHYQIEHPSANEGHDYEDHSPGYGHYGSMLNGSAAHDGGPGQEADEDMATEGATDDEQ